MLRATGREGKEWILGAELIWGVCEAFMLKGQRRQLKGQESDVWAKYELEYFLLMNNEVKSSLELPQAFFLYKIP